jgi:hypothetical protein
LSACGGGGGGGGNSAPSPQLSVSGPSTVWSDDYDWSAQATVSGLDTSSVGYSISGGDEYIEIDSVTGVINSNSSNVDIGTHRFTVSAADSSGKRASTTYDLKSNAFIAGIWKPYNEDAGTYFSLWVTRSGQIFSDYWEDFSDDDERCSGKFTISASALDGEIKCLSVFSGMEDKWTADIEAVKTSTSNDITYNKMTITGGQYAGEVADESRDMFQNGVWVNGNIVPGDYFAIDDMGYRELRVNLDGTFNTLTQEESTARIADVGPCQISGSFPADPVYGLPTLSENFFQLGVHDAMLSGSDCSVDFDEPMSAAVALADFSAADYSTPILLFATSGSSSYNDGFNTGLILYIQACDEYGQPTLFMTSNGLTCSATTQSRLNSGDLSKVKKYFSVLRDRFNSRG